MRLLAGFGRTRTYTNDPYVNVPGGGVKWVAGQVLTVTLKFKAP